MFDIEKGVGLIEKIQKLGFTLSQLDLIGGLTAACWYQWDWVKANRLFVILMVFLYEIIVGVAVFTSKLWKQEFEKETLKASADWLRALPGKYSPGFLRDYQRQVCFDHEIFNVRGLGLIAAHTLKIEHVFVDLKISPSGNPNQLNLDPVAAKQFGDAHDGYIDLAPDYVHQVINHAEAYVKGNVHTNGIENFWSLLKRA